MCEFEASLPPQLLSGSSSISLAARTYIGSRSNLAAARHSGESVCSWKTLVIASNVPWGGEVWGVQTPPEIPKALQNRAKLNPIVQTVKNC